MVAEGGEGENPLPFSLTAPKRGGGGRGGVVGGVSRLRFPAGPHLRSSRFSRHPRLRQAPTRRFAKKSYFVGKRPRPWLAGPQALGARAPSPLETWPTGPWGLDPATADLGGRWMVSESGAVQFHERRGSCPAFQPLGRAPSFGDLANKPLSPASRSRIPKMPRCSSAHEKPGLLHREISCAQSLQPSLTFLLRRNNKVQGARS